MVEPTYLLDTNMWIFLLKGKNPTLTERLGKIDPAAIALCSVVKAELWHGTHRYGNRERRVSILHTIFEQHKSFGFDDRAAEVYGQICHDLEARGQVIGPMDMLIAAIALANRLTLVTHNTNEFSRLDELLLEDWTA
ncbi:MAG: type II toxin-antitoxin system VapC family toxin [Chloroflexota bacterium]